MNYFKVSKKLCVRLMMFGATFGYVGATLPKFEATFGYVGATFWDLAQLLHMLVQIFKFGATF